MSPPSGGGGSRNTAGGNFSFAAERRAKVRAASQAGEDPRTCPLDTCGDEGSFVWADSSDFDFPSATETNITACPNQFLARTTGGAVFVTAIDGSGNSTETIEFSTGGDITASGTITSGSSSIIDGIANTITSTGDLELHVSGGRAMRIEGNATSPNLIGGYSGNSREPGAVGATIGGGGAAAGENRVFDEYSTVSGGRNNKAGSDDANPGNHGFATVGGGNNNTASVDVTAPCSIPTSH